MPLFSMPLFSPSDDGRRVNSAAGQMILSALQAVLRGEDTAFSLGGGSVDGDRFVHMARRHGVAALVARAPRVLEAFPSAGRTALEADRQRTTHFNMHRHRVLLRLLAELDAEGVPAIPLKGPLLAERYYGDVGLRTFGDLDILVSQARAEQTRKTLRAAGFEPLQAMGEAERRRFWGKQLAYEMRRPRDGIEVEIHTALMHRIHAFRLTADDVRRRSRPVETGGQTVFALAPDDLLLYLCAHGTKHWWKRLLWVCDIDRVVDQGSVDWPRVWKRAARRGSLRALKMGLYVAHDWLHTPLPESFREAVTQDATVQALAGRLRKEWLFHPADPEEAGLSTQLAYYLRTKERWRDRIPYLRHFATLAGQPTKRDRDFLALPDGMEAFYYAVRPVRIALEYLRSGEGREGEWERE